jgi:hypothetical protein
MEELLLGLLWSILELVFEAVFEGVFEYLAAGLASLLLRALGVVSEISAIQNPVLATCVYALFGGLLGGVSLLFFPHHLVKPSRIHGISLLVSPVITGLMMWATGAVLRRRGKRVTQLESFGYGFAFAFGMALVRFFFAK